MPLWSYLVAVPVFGLMLLVHELGHYLAGRYKGIAVAEFSVGIGPRLFGFRANGTDWSVRLLPIFGYVRWHDEGEEAFSEAPVSARFWALLWGPLANILLTYVLLVGLAAGVWGLGWQAPLVALERLQYVTTLVVGGYAELFSGGGLDLTGPVGLTQATAQAAAQGIEQLLTTAIFLSMNLAVFNLLPVPALDGGRICFVLLERIRRRQLDPYVEGWIHAGGFLLLIGLALFTTVKDLIA